MTHDRVALAQRIITLQPIHSVDPAFLATALMSPPLQASIRSRATGTTAQGIKASKLKLIPLPIPPLPEQRAIVAKVAHLMKLCDDMELKLRSAEATATKLVEAVVAEIVAGMTEAI